MDTSFGVLFMLWALLEKYCGSRPWHSRRREPEPAPLPEWEPSGDEDFDRYGGTPGMGTPKATPAATPPWPQTLPADLPPFPGSGWEFDEPPPKVVQQRAGQLLAQLWSRGRGSFRTENTAGRWITYQAQIVRSGKKGVVAYRQRKAASAQLPGVARAPGPVKARPRAVAVRPGAVVTPASSSKAPRTPAHPLKLPVLRLGRGLKPAAPDPDVRIAQQRLRITADGRFGRGTKRAVEAFQRSRGLQIDGVVGPKTWAALLAIVV